MPVSYRRELNSNSQGTLPAFPLRRFFFEEIQMSDKSPKGLEMKGLDGSNPPRSQQPVWLLRVSL